MRILISNDDGIEAPGIAALAEVASHFGDVTVVAPTEGVSSCGHHVTTHRDLVVTEVRSGWYSVDGYPADCVRVALTVISDDFDLVLAGINDGGNLGMDLLMSGTASAAREAVLHGKRGIAVSQYKAQRGEANWKRAIIWTQAALHEVINRAPPDGTFWNLNLPDPQVESGQPPIIECEIDRLPLPVGYRYEGGIWRYTSRYQERLRNAGLDVALCFGGAITLSAAPTFFGTR
jgi:5'-nucleotidase